MAVITGVRKRNGKLQWDVEIKGKEILVEADSQDEAIVKALKGDVVKKAKKRGRG